MSEGIDHTAAADELTAALAAEPDSDVATMAILHRLASIDEKLGRLVEMGSAELVGRAIGDGHLAFDPYKVRLATRDDVERVLGDALGNGG